MFRNQHAAAVAGILLLGTCLITACEPTATAGRSTATAGTQSAAGTQSPTGATPPTGAQPATSTQPARSRFQITMRNEQGTLEPEASYTATVPVLSGPDATVVARVNATITDYVAEEKSRTAYETLTLKAGNPHVGAQVLALSFGGDRYPPGAAHPAELASGLVFDLRTGDRVTIEDVFTSTGAGLRRLESLVRAELDRRFPGGPTGGVTDPDPVNYQQFVVNPQGLVVIVADLPYVLGPQSVLAPWEQLDGLVRPELADVLRS